MKNSMTISPEVLSERLNNMEKQNAKDHESLWDWIKEVKDIMVEFIDKAEKKYAPKTSVDKIWKIIWGIIAFVFTWLWGAILFLILK